MKKTSMLPALVAAVALIAVPLTVEAKGKKSAKPAAGKVHKPAAPKKAAA